ncbi:conserved Plasmodium protein, unknown function [Plasmodium gaboni]|uniref:Inhibitor of growth protein N-terminal histone-binding domain-containing protein n=1 Tax=Plasmodium gaboni TaxID=647221 RepID=A0ABY1UQL0_9APIC|nr:conserved Plasmodium protein, unknown function [Plasmodium gaboni]
MNPLLEYKRIKEALSNSSNKNSFHQKKDIIINKDKNNIVRDKKIIENKYIKPLKHENNKFKRDNIEYIKYKTKDFVINKEHTRKKYEEEEYTLLIPEDDTINKNKINQTKYEYCYICDATKPCECLDNYCPYEDNNWKCTTLKSNIHSNLKEISNIIENIQTNKRKNENPIKAITKKNTIKNNQTIMKYKDKNKEINKPMSAYEKFYLEKMKVVKHKLNDVKNKSDENWDMNKELDKYLNEVINVKYEEICNMFQKRLDALKDIEKKHLNLLVNLIDEHKEMEDVILPIINEK